MIYFFFCIGLSLVVAVTYCVWWICCICFCIFSVLFPYKGEKFWKIHLKFYFLFCLPNVFFCLSLAGNYRIYSNPFVLWIYRTDGVDFLDTDRNYRILRCLLLYTKNLCSCENRLNVK